MENRSANSRGGNGKGHRARMPLPWASPRWFIRPATLAPTVRSSRRTASKANAKAKFAGDAHQDAGQMAVSAVIPIYTGFIAGLP